MKSRHSQLAQVVGIAVIAVMATACGGAKAKIAAAGATGNATGGATAADSAAGAAPVKATGGGNFCKTLASSINSQALYASGSSANDTKTVIETARAGAHKALSLAPSEIKKDVAVLVAATDSMYDALAKAGYDYSKLTAADMAGLSSTDVTAAEEHLTAYVKGTCGIDLAGGASVGSSDAGTPAAAGATDAGGGATADAGKACQLATVAQISTAAGKPMQNVGGAGDTICVFSAVDDASFAMDVTIYNDDASMASMKQVEVSGSEQLSGLGDSAFWNSTIGVVFVKKGSRGFSFALPSFANLTDNPAAIKNKMVTLAQQALSNF